MDDPPLLRAISVPVLVLDGANSGQFYSAGTRHVADHVPNARIHEIPGAGHAAPLTHPDALAESLIEFFAPHHHRGRAVSEALPQSEA